VTRNDGDEKTRFREQLRAFEGVSAGPENVSPYPVNVPMIHHWCDAIGDANPSYTDPEFAEGSVHGGIVAPPTMLQAWTMRGLKPVSEEEIAASKSSQLYALLDGAGFSSVVATNCDQEYPRYLRPGDRISHTVTIEKISDEKKTALGAGHFITQLYTFRDQKGEIVGSMRFRILKFKPPAAGAAKVG
jgi:acyl dehydratase